MIKKFLARATRVYYYFFLGHARAVERLNNHQLGVWIQRGLTSDAIETNKVYMEQRADGRIACCALGFGLVGKTGSPEKAFAAYEKNSARSMYALAQLLHVSNVIAHKVVSLANGGLPAKMIATCLIEGTLT